MATKKKICPKCKEGKRLAKFGDRKYTLKNGEIKITKASHCRDCNIQRVNEWKEKNKEKFSNYQAKYDKEKRVAI